MDTVDTLATAQPKNKRRKKLIRRLIMFGMIAALLGYQRGTGFDTSEASKVGKFPKITADSLAKKTFNLPADFAGDFQLVAIAYKQFQQSQVDAWGPIVSAITKSHPNVEFYELPTVSNSLGYNNPAFRFSLAQGMRSGIPDQDTRAHTITIYVDQKSFTKQLGLSGLDQMHLIVLNRAGQVIWNTAGSPTADSEASLLKFIGEVVG
jgi:hypothetical protein